jgi:hypothetical protein
MQLKKIGINRDFSKIRARKVRRRNNKSCKRKYKRKRTLARK